MLNKYNLYYRTFLVLFWGAMCWGFVTEEFLTFLAPLENAFFLLMDVALLVIGMCLLRRKRDVAILLSFLGIAVLSTVLINRLSFLTFFNGSRDFFGILFVVPVLAFFLSGDRAVEFKTRFDRQLRIWLALQAFCLVWQFIRYGANDHGGGTMGYGASGMVSMLIYIVSYYLTIQNWDFDDYWGSFKRNKWNVLLLIPTYLNETKFSFLLLVLYFILLFRPTRRTLLQMAYVLPVAIVLFIGVMHLYLSTIDDTIKTEYDVLSWEYLSEYIFSGDDLDDRIELALDLQEGVVEQDPDYDLIVDIERVAKINFMPDLVEKTRGGIFLGAGLGHFKGGTTVAETQFMRTNKWILIGTRPWIFTVFIQLGVSGLLWFFGSFYFDCFYKVKRNGKQNRLYFLLTVCMLLMLVYNEAFRYYYFCIVYFYLYLAIRLYKPTDAKRLTA